MQKNTATGGHFCRLAPLPSSLADFFFVAIDALINGFNYANGESNVELHSVIVHETDTGYAQCFRDDAYSKKMGLIDLGKVIFSDDVKREWSSPDILGKILN